jgi:hypothetical protein
MTAKRTKIRLVSVDDVYEPKRGVEALLKTESDIRVVIFIPHEAWLRISEIETGVAPFLDEIREAYIRGAVQ